MTSLKPEDWAQAFLESVKDKPELAFNKDYLSGWFANALGSNDTTTFRNEEYRTYSPVVAKVIPEKIILQCGSLLVHNESSVNGFPTKILIDGIEPKCKTLALRFAEGEPVWVEMVFLPDTKEEAIVERSRQNSNIDMFAQKLFAYMSKFLWKKPDEPKVWSNKWK